MMREKGRCSIDNFNGSATHAQVLCRPEWSGVHGVEARSQTAPQTEVRGYGRCAYATAGYGLQRDGPMVASGEAAMAAVSMVQWRFLLPHDLTTNN
ncbi:hypothetical protein E2562_012631 [Oryza meyeriana var. granulata]|uniref:Uncharacterized protein n=1 Tax=Oryza meyeriana var. granulata TaxID=110450 RepID=A0A6G1CE79_9ORYZ|nr:hypothetical protein E2562_012631 [Oryza meyeriana var. granulata]